MAYEKQTWIPYDDNKTEEQNIQNGAVVTAERINHLETGLDEHDKNTTNPHKVTKTQVGLGNVTNVEQASKTDLTSHASNKTNPHGVTKSQVGLGNVSNVEQASKTEFDGHVADKTNPHSVTKAQVNLGNVDNYATANQTDSEQGFAGNKFITPMGVKQHVDKRIATQAEAEAGTSETAIMTPKATKQAIEKIAANTSVARKSYTGVSTIESSERGKFNSDGAILSFKRTGNLVLFNAKLNHTGGMKWVTNIMATGIPNGYRASKEFYETQFAIPLNIVPPKQTGTVIQWSRYTIDDDNIFIYSDNTGNHFISGEWLTIDPFPEEDIV